MNIYVKSCIKTEDSDGTKLQFHSFFLCFYENDRLHNVQPNFGRKSIPAIVKIALTFYLHYLLTI